MLINQNIPLQKKIMKKLCTKKTPSKLLLLNFLTERKNLMKNLTFVRQKYF